VSLVAALLLPALAARGSTKIGYGDATATGFSGVTISGKPGKAPDVTWHKEIAYPKTTTVKILVKGTGAAVRKGDSSADATPQRTDSDRLQDAFRVGG